MSLTFELFHTDAHIMGKNEVKEDLLPSGARLATDISNQTVILFPEQWACDFFAQRHPEVPMAILPPRTQRGQLDG